MRQSRRKRHDGAAPARHHAADDRLIAPDHAIEVDLDDAPPFVGNHAGDRRARLDSSRTHEPVEAPEIAFADLDSIGG